MAAPPIAYGITTHLMLNTHFRDQNTGPAMQSIAPTMRLIAVNVRLRGHMKENTMLCETRKIRLKMYRNETAKPNALDASTSPSLMPQMFLTSCWRPNSVA